MKAHAASVIIVVSLATGVAAHSTATPASPAQTSRGRGAATSPVAPDRLIALLPTIPGWTKGEPDGELVTFGMTMTVVRVSYQKDDLSLNLEIIDTLANPALTSAFTQMMARAGSTPVKTEGGWVKAIIIGGFPGAEVWDTESKTNDVLVILEGRFVVKAGSSGTTDTAAARQAVERVNLKALAAMK